MDGGVGMVWRGREGHEPGLEITVGQQTTSGQEWDLSSQNQWMAEHFVQMFRAISLNIFMSQHY